ncbi:hypothetical protein K7X08_008413 [Anisodus acutangulus]|uniref:Vacuolar protein sorting-associated protein 51 homolog n=1 Tax=Anisodus acutangulus TaxID=402998 RepID=A0A9Q1RP49_9SOLA|nr:hypothetical protein K7X08_008413 [Anisodus acutangulus]
MFVDLLLQELDTILNEVKQILPEGLHPKHRRTDSNGSATSSRSNPLRDDRLTFNRSGFQQIQLDIHFLKTTLKDTDEDEAAIDFLLDEAILDRLTQAKLAKNSEQRSTS